MALLHDHLWRWFSACALPILHTLIKQEMFAQFHEISLRRMNALTEPDGAQHKSSYKRPERFQRSRMHA